MGGLLDALGDTARAHQLLVSALKKDAMHLPAMVNLAGLMSRGTTRKAARAAQLLWDRCAESGREGGKEGGRRGERERVGGTAQLLWDRCAAFLAEIEGKERGREER